MRSARIINNERGFVKFTAVLLILACIVYVGLKVGIPYYKYSVFKSEAKEIARISVAYSLDRTHTQLYEQAQKLNLPLGDEDIEVKQTAKGVRIITAWSETVDFLGLYQHTFDFSIDVEE